MSGSSIQYLAGALEAAAAVLRSDRSEAPRISATEATSVLRPKDRAEALPELAGSWGCLGSGGCCFGNLSNRESLSPTRVAFSTLPAVPAPQRSAYGHPPARHH